MGQQKDWTLRDLGTQEGRGRKEGRREKGGGAYGILIVLDSIYSYEHSMVAMSSSWHICHLF